MKRIGKYNHLKIISSSPFFSALPYFGIQNGIFLPLSLMEIYALFSLIFGAIIGSFLNVVILRLNTGQLLGNNRSECPYCMRILSFWDLIPIFSFLFLRGRCRTCFSKISWQYPLVETATAVLFFLGFVKVSSANSDFIPFILTLIFYFIIFSCLVVIFVYDLRHKIIPDYPLYTFIITSIVGTLMVSIGFLGQSLGITLTNILVGSLLTLPFYFLWLVSDGRWLGFGDVKLVLGIGIFLGISQGISAIVIAFWSGAIVGILLLLIQRLLDARKIKNRLIMELKKITIKSEIPFAPFLIFGNLLAFFCDLWVSSLLNIFN